MAAKVWHIWASKGAKKCPLVPGARGCLVEQVQVEVSSKNVLVQHMLAISPCETDSMDCLQVDLDPGPRLFAHSRETRWFHNLWLQLMLTYDCWIKSLSWMLKICQGYWHEIAVLQVCSVHLGCFSCMCTPCIGNVLWTILARLCCHIFLPIKWFRLPNPGSD